MPKNTRGGKGHKKGKNKTHDDQKDEALVIRNDDQIYACVLSRKGGSRVEVTCHDGAVRSALIPGKFIRRVWINKDDILLCDYDMNDTSRCYIRYKYTKREAQMLKNKGEIKFDINFEEEREPGFKYAELDDLEDDESDDENVMVQHNLDKLDLPQYDSDTDQDDD